jgi:hypothetical protein
VYTGNHVFSFVRFVLTCFSSSLSVRKTSKWVSEPTNPFRVRLNNGM